METLLRSCGLVAGWVAQCLANRTQPETMDFCELNFDPFGALSSSFCRGNGDHYYGRYYGISCRMCKHGDRTGRGRYRYGTPRSGKTGQGCRQRGSGRHSDIRRCGLGHNIVHEFFVKVARLTGLEPATPGVTGRYSNQLSYNRA